MRIFETRHGQVATKDYYKNDPSLPAGDVPLSPLGEEQAHLLGQRLKELKFKGVIFSSPYYRTMKTASIVAEILGLTVMPLACLHEIVTKPNPDFQGSTAEQIKKNFPLADREFTLPPCWWGDTLETSSEVIVRVKEGLEPILKQLPKDIDVLIVGHGAIASALRHLFGHLDLPPLYWNCHLSLLYSSEGEPCYNTCDHMPEEMWTGNAVRHLDKVQAQKELDEKVAQFRKAHPGKRILHIGDTLSGHYGIYKRLIEATKPDVIVHTGDLADELKAGRIETAVPYWRVAARKIVDIMNGAGVPVIIVPGNNDLVDDLREFAPDAQIVPNNTVMELLGTKVLLLHQVHLIDETADVELVLYGHGLTKETRTVETNAENGKRYYNAMWGASLHVPEEDAHLIIPLV